MRVPQSKVPSSGSLPSSFVLCTAPDWPQREQTGCRFASIPCRDVEIEGEAGTTGGPCKERKKKERKVASGPSTGPSSKPKRLQHLKRAAVQGFAHVSSM